MEAWVLAMLPSVEPPSTSERLAKCCTGTPAFSHRAEKIAQEHVHAQCHDLADYKRVRKIVVSKDPLERTSFQKVRRVAYKGKLDE